jgi:hypothetical protein
MKHSACHSRKNQFIIVYSATCKPELSGLISKIPSKGRRFLKNEIQAVLVQIFGKTQPGLFSANRPILERAKSRHKPKNGS